MTAVYLARVLGADGFGLFGFVSALSAYVILFSNFGIEQFATQRLSLHGKNESAQFIVTVLASRLMLSFIFIVPFILFAANYSKSNEALLLFLFQSVFIAAFALNLQFYFVASGATGMLALIKIATAAGILVCSYLFISGSSDLPFVALINGTVTLVFFLIGAVIVFRKEQIPLRFPSLHDIGDLLKTAAPLGVSTFMIQIYYSIDIVILGFTNPGYDLGYYSGAYRIILAFTAIPGFLYLVYLPELVKIKSNHFEAKIVRNYIGTQISLGLVIVGMSLIYAETLIILLLGETYLPAVGVFRILLLNVFVVFVNVAIGNLLIAWNRHKQYLVAVTAGAITNIVVNILLIPPYGILGAAVATIAAECAVFIAALYYNYTLFGLFTKRR
ncbi:MAG: oligosaccharide flippase family protein [Ignavibacteriales bacterium]|nr:oligosaccharide flippase family protein [Ignavibacteriales bacterium]